MAKMKLCLIGGSGRSGTTILRKVFSKHAAFSEVPEFRFLVDPDGLVDFYDTLKHGWSPYLFDVKLRRLEKLLLDMERPAYISGGLKVGLGKLGLTRTLPKALWRRYYYVGLKKFAPNYHQLVDELIDDLKEFDFRGEWVGMGFGDRPRMSYAGLVNPEDMAAKLGKFYRNLAHAIVTEQGVDHYLEKNTWNILWFDRILDLVPDAKFVHIFRDPRDVVASMVKQNWAPSDPELCALWLSDIMAQWWHIRERVPAESYLEVKFETLMDKPEETLQGICDFWGVPMDPEMLNIKLSGHHMGRWRKQFSQLAAANVEKQVKPIMQAYGYS
ncbi:MAG: hypothetical protein ACI9TH_002237 [Kiritimatiellia bacterium]|jgi:hypothetical protein